MHRTMSATALLVGGLIMFAAMPGLAEDLTPDPFPAASGSSTGVPLEGTTWLLTDLRLSGAFAPIPPGAPATLILDDGHAGGTGGCNDWFADYTLAGDSLAVGVVGSTLKLCEGAGGMVETFYFADLPAVSAWVIDGTTLTLSADDGQPVLRYTVQPTPSLVGSWVVTAYGVGGDALVPVDDGSVTLTIAAASLSGTAGCNRFRGNWTQDGSTLAVGPLLSTKMACEPAEVMTRETAVMADLEASTALRPSADGGIELLDTTGAVTLVIVPDASEGTPAA